MSKQISPLRQRMIDHIAIRNKRQSKSVGAVAIRKVCLWHEAADPECPLSGRYQVLSGP